jgi:hypothetical protein
MRPSGWFMSVSRAVVATPIGLTVATSELGEQLRASVQRFHEGAAAEFHVEHEGVEPFGQLLAHDAGGDERDRGTVAVTSRRA